MAEELFYSAEDNVQLLIQLMKAHGIRKVIVSPDTTNIAFGVSVRNEPYFQIYSSVDERSAAYMACGMAAESGEPVALSCTGSGNYMPGLTEAFYRKLPVLAITSSQSFAQPADFVRTSLQLPLPTTKATIAAYAVKVNDALLELRRNGGGPVHINLETNYGKDLGVKELPEFNVIRRYVTADTFPPIPKDIRVAIFVGAHKPFTKEQTAAVDKFCAAYDAVVFTEHTGGYKGKYAVLATILAAQSDATEFDALLTPNLLIYIGEQSDDYYMLDKLRGSKAVWRVSPDGEVCSTFGKLRKVFQMSEQGFFSHYVETAPSTEPRDAYLKSLLAATKKFYAQIPDVPFSSIWLAKTTSQRLPEGCAVHQGVSSAVRSWAFFQLPQPIMSCVSIGCRGIDGALSSALGMSLASPDKLFFTIIDELAFFYDMNAPGNRHVGSNLRILLINSGRNDFADKSPGLIRHYAQDLGFEYLTASNKAEYLQQLEHFVSPEKFDKPILFEVFTNPKEERDALLAMRNITKQFAPTFTVAPPKPQAAPKIESATKPQSKPTFTVAPPKPQSAPKIESATKPQSAPTFTVAPPKPQAAPKIESATKPQSAPTFTVAPPKPQAAPKIESATKPQSAPTFTVAPPKPQAAPKIESATKPQAAPTFTVAPPKPQAAPKIESATKPQSAPKIESATKPQSAPTFTVAPPKPQAAPKIESATKPQSAPTFTVAPPKPQAAPKIESATNPQSAPKIESATKPQSAPTFTVAPPKPQAAPKIESATNPQSAPTFTVAPPKPQAAPKIESATKPTPKKFELRPMNFLPVGQKN